MVSHQVDHVRALVRVFQTINDVRFLLLLRSAGVSQAEIERFAHDVGESLSPADRASLDRDFKHVGLPGGF